MNLQSPSTCLSDKAEFNKDNVEECNDDIHENAFNRYEEKLKYIKKKKLFTKSGNRLSHV